LIDQTKLPVAPLPVTLAGTESAPGEYFAPATQFSVNKALNSYFLFFLDPDSNAVVDFLENTFGE
jgi:hypothetical protein